MKVWGGDASPEVNKAHSFRANVIHFLVFCAGLGLLFAIAALGEH